MTLRVLFAVCILSVFSAQNCYSQSVESRSSSPDDPALGHDPATQTVQQAPKRKTARIVRMASAGVCYANEFRIQFNKGEAFLDFGVIRSDPATGNGRFEIQRRMALSPYMFKRSQGSLALAVQRHERAFGKLAMDKPAATKTTSVPKSKETHYSNFLRVSSTPEEIILDLGLNVNTGNKSSVTVQVTDIIVMSHQTGKRLLAAIVAEVKKYEAKHGVIELDARKRLKPQKNLTLN